MPMSITPGGLIKQCIKSDGSKADNWDPDNSIVFNVQILNTEAFRQVTGMMPPQTPISAATYAHQGLPFYEIYNEASVIKGDFKGIKSINEVDKVTSTKGKSKEGTRQGGRRARLRFSCRQAQS